MLKIALLFENLIVKHFWFRVYVPVKCSQGTLVSSLSVWKQPTKIHGLSDFLKFSVLI